jgi:hypothetical protein
MIIRRYEAAYLLCNAQNAQHLIGLPQGPGST